MTSCAWVFARGGSKGLPGKNIRNLVGRPLIGWAIEHARASGCFQRILVSTDDPAIAEAAHAEGAEIPFMRPAELAADDSPEWLAWQHAAAWQAEHCPDLPGFVSVPATAPLRRPADLGDACERLAEGHDLVLAVTPAHRHPAFNLVRRGGAGRVSLWDGGGAATRRQDVADAFDITTVVYATTVHHVLAARGVLDGDISSIIVPPERAVDIDTELDLEWARFLMERQRG